MWKRVAGMGRCGHGSKINLAIVDRNFRGLCWSVAVYYLVLMLAVFAVHSPARTDSTIGEAVGTAAGAPILAILLFSGGLSVINVWIAFGVVVGVLAGLIAAIVRLRGRLRIAVVLVLLTIMNLDAVYIGARVGA